MKQDKAKLKEFAPEVQNSLKFYYSKVTFQ